MKQNSLVWLASYPRSGNTLLRTVLWHCFGLKSGSVYANDLGGNRQLEAYVGHIERAPDGRLHFPASNGQLPLLKTHGYPNDNSPAIYVIRDGRAACVSLWAFYDKKLSLEDIVEGRHRFGTWTQHVDAWQPWNRPDTLLLRYEDLAGHLPVALRQISGFLQRDILCEQIPDRKTIAEADGQWVKTASDWQSVLSGDLLQRFNQINRNNLVRAGYLAPDA